MIHITDLLGKVNNDYLLLIVVIAGASSHLWRIQRLGSEAFKSQRQTELRIRCYVVGLGEWLVTQVPSDSKVEVPRTVGQRRGAVCRLLRVAPRSAKDRWCRSGNQGPAKNNLTTSA
jgi:hypothetical protein